jgi:hypothetical protein
LRSSRKSVLSRIRLACTLANQLGNYWNGYTARSRLRVDPGMAASGAILPIRRALDSPGFALEATFNHA